MSTGFMNFYILTPSTMNTFSKKDADNLVDEHGMCINKICSIYVDRLPDIIERHCDGKFPDFLSLDVEGLDKQVLNTINYDIAFPKVICVETISYSTNGKGEKNLGIADYLLEKDYLLYADTNINSIFVKRSFWEI